MTRAFRAERLHLTFSAPLPVWWCSCCLVCQASRILLLAAALAILCSVTNAQYTFTPGNADNQPIWKCDKTKVDKIANEAARAQCQGFCTRVEKTVTDLEDSDKKLGADDQKKLCLQTATSLWQLLDAVEMYDMTTVKKLISVIHKGTCLESLLKDWSARDAACMPSFYDPDNPAQYDGFVAAGKRVAKRRLFSVMTQFYNTMQPKRRSDGSEVEGNVVDDMRMSNAVADMTSSDDSTAVLSQRRGGSDPLPAEETWCVVDVMNFITNFNAILFDKDLCGNMNPIWNNMAQCPAGCWKNSILRKVKLGGCIAMYHSLTSGMFLENTKLIENKKATDDALKLPTVWPPPPKERGADDLKKLPLLLPFDAVISEKCQGEALPCKSIDAAIALCAAADSVSKDDLVKYQSKVQTSDSYGHVSKGGVMCKQGPSCSH